MFGGGVPPARLKGSAWLCAQECPLVVLREPHAVTGLKLWVKTVASKASTWADNKAGRAFICLVSK